MRASKGSPTYWDKWVNYILGATDERQEQLKELSGDSSYRPQYAFNLAREYWQLIFYRYSRGDAVIELVQYFEPLLNAWEESNRLGEEIFTTEQKKSRRDWSVNLDHYIVCFWLVGLALALNVENKQWERLLILIANEGNDILLDRIIASRQHDRIIGTRLCHPKPYARLLKAIDIGSDKQASFLRDFLDHWYVELNRPGTKKMPTMYARPYWYKFGDENFEGGAYFGRWCVEAVAATKAFGLDDSLCLGHEHYPGDLLRPAGPSTHLPRPEEIKLSWFKQLLKK